VIIFVAHVDRNISQPSVIGLSCLVRILRFAILLFQYFYSRRKCIYIAAVVSLSRLPGGNVCLSSYALRGFRSLALSSRKLSCDRCPPRGKTSNSRRDMTQLDDSCIIYPDLISQRSERKTERKRERERERERERKNTFHKYDIRNISNIITSVRYKFSINRNNQP